METTCRKGLCQVQQHHRLHNVTDKKVMSAGLFTEPLGNGCPAHLHRCCSHFWGVCKLSSSKFPLGYTEDEIWTQKISDIWIYGDERSTATQLGASLGVLLWQKITAALLPNGPASSDVSKTEFSLSWDLKADFDMKNQCLSSELILECLLYTKQNQTRLIKKIIQI